MLLADDHAAFRQGLGEMLSTDEKIEVIGEAENGKEAVTLVHRERLDVVILDVEMPVMGAAEAMEEMLETSPSPRILIVTMQDNSGSVKKLLANGACCYLPKSASIEELVAAVHTAAGGK